MRLVSLLAAGVVAAATALAAPAMARAAAAPVASAAVPGLGQLNPLTVFQWLQQLPPPPTAAGGWHPRFAYPLRSFVETQAFGCTNFYLEKGTGACPGGFHTGVDLADPEGTPIYAAAAGYAYAFQDPKLRYGNHVLVVHPGGYSTVYGHMVRTAVSWGQPVAAGDLIGFVGSTGNSTGPHLHFEIRLAGVPLDPTPYLTGAGPHEPFPLPAGWQGAAPDDPWGPG